MATSTCTGVRARSRTGYPWPDPLWEPLGTALPGSRVVAMNPAAVACALRQASPNSQNVRTDRTPTPCDQD